MFNEAHFWIGFALGFTVCAAGASLVSWFSTRKSPWGQFADFCGFCWFVACCGLLELWHLITGHKEAE